MTKTLDGMVRAFHARPLSDDYQYLILDAITHSVRGALKASKKKVLVAYGIDVFGFREIIDFRQVSTESQASWEGFLFDLWARGLEGKSLRLITTDGCKGLHNALDMYYGLVPRQLCWAHKLRNVANYLPRRYQEECISRARTIYNTSTRQEAIRIYRQWAETWKRVSTKAVECLARDMDALLPFLDCPEAHRVRVRTTNVIERASREVRRRTRTMSCFTNAASCERIIYVIFNHLNNHWKKRRLKGFDQFQMEDIQYEFTHFS